MKKIILSVLLSLAGLNTSLWAMGSRPNADPNAPPPPAWVSWAPILFMFGVIYLLILRPQSKQRKDHQSMLQNLKKGDRIITQGGFYATILNVGPDYFEVKLSEETKVKLQKSAVTQVLVDKAPSNSNDPVPTAKS